MAEPRAMTPDEVRQRFLAQVRDAVRYWEARPGLSAHDRCEGVAHTVLAILDGSMEGLPSADIVFRPRPEDKPYLQGEGENWIEDGTVINADERLAPFVTRPKRSASAPLPSTDAEKD